MCQHTELTDISLLIPNINIDLKYATSDNITGKPIYRNPVCLLHPDAARRLMRSAEIAHLAGFALLIYDAWRPAEAQRHLFRACPDPRFVVPVEIGSNHCRGVAIDLTLTNSMGDILDMGSEFDEMSEISSRYHQDIPVATQRHRLLLDGIMFASGFTGLASEWWHYELPDARHYPLLEGKFDCYPVSN